MILYYSLHRGSNNLEILFTSAFIDPFFHHCGARFPDKGYLLTSNTSNGTQSEWARSEWVTSDWMTEVR